MLESIYIVVAVEPDVIGHYSEICKLVDNREILQFSVEILKMSVIRVKLILKVFLGFTQLKFGPYSSVQLVFQ